MYGAAQDGIRASYFPYQTTWQFIIWIGHFLPKVISSVYIFFISIFLLAAFLSTIHRRHHA